MSFDIRFVINIVTKRRETNWIHMKARGQRERTNVLKSKRGKHIHTHSVEHLVTNRHIYNVVKSLNAFNHIYGFFMMNRNYGFIWNVSAIWFCSFEAHSSVRMQMNELKMVFVYSIGACVRFL